MPRTRSWASCSSKVHRKLKRPRESGLTGSTWVMWMSLKGRRRSCCSPVPISFQFGKTGRLRPEDVHFEPGMAAVFAYRSNLYQHAPTPFEDCFKVGEAHHENVFGAIERL